MDPLHGLYDADMGKILPANIGGLADPIKSAWTGTCVRNSFLTHIEDYDASRKPGVQQTSPSPRM